MYFVWDHSLVKICLDTYRCRVLSAGLKHLVLNRDTSEWTSGPFKGIVVSCLDDLTRDLHTIGAKNNGLEILPHSNHFETDQVKIQLKSS